MISRLGVFGGMFDPVHNGHIEAARYAKDLLSLDLVKLIPCNIPNHKTRSHASAADRLSLLQIAVKDESGIEVDDIELRKSSVSYSVETLRAIKAQKLSRSITFIMGMDSFNSITNWFDWEGLFSICSFFVLGRSGLVVNEEMAGSIRLGTRLTDSVSEFQSESCGKVFIASKFSIDLSSTSVRTKLNAGLGMGNCLKQEVFNYITVKNLYS